MSEKKSEATVSLQLTLARWKSPSSWDVVMQDEPLDKPQGEWVPTFGSNASATGVLGISIPVGTTVSSTNNTFLVTAAYSNIETAIMARLTREIDEEVFNTLNGARGSAAPGQGNGRPSTAYGWGNEPPSGRLLPPGLPYPRNHKERRILKSIQGKLPQLLKRAEQLFGPREEARLDEEWNDSFWKMVTHAQVDTVERRKSKK